MGLFDEVAGGLLKQVLASESGRTALMNIVMGLFKGPDGSKGVEGLAQAFNQKGLGEIMSSWIGKGENMPISPEQIQQVLGSGQVQQIAGKLGVSSKEASSGLAEMLPQVVDKLTPDGSLPSEDLLNQGLGLVMNKLLGK